MGVLGGFVVGYLFGARAGRQGLEELVEAFNTIRKSDEVRAWVSGAASIARDVVMNVLREQLQSEPRLRAVR